MFSDTMALTGGVPVRYPISVNDVWEGRTFGISDEALSKNQALHEVFGKFSTKLRDFVNEAGEFKYPLQSWNPHGRYLKTIAKRFGKVCQHGLWHTARKIKAHGMCRHIAFRKRLRST
ncbi:MAG: hypothetical protein EBT73_06825 [Actinobacteria bacterium]|nr:hypothetical protein [Actinomycetota bacterium]